MENKRVGFAESIYSDLSAEDSAVHNQQILLNMSSFEELEYFFESAGFDNGPQILIGVLITTSVILGAVIAELLLRNTEESETKVARKALAAVLNEGKSQQELAEEDTMFEVPLNDERRPKYNAGLI